MKISRAIFITVGGMFGSAIFTLSGLTIKNAGSGAILSWVLAGLIMLGFGFCTKALLKVYPESGGMYYFPERVFKSKVLGGISSLFYLFGCLSGAIFSLSYIGVYLVQLFPELENFQFLVLLAVMLIVFNLIWRPWKYFSVATSILTILLILGSLILVIFLYLNLGLPIINFNNFVDWNSVIIETPTAILGYGAIVTPVFLTSVFALNKTKKISPVSQVLLIASNITIFLYGLISAFLSSALTTQDFNEVPYSEYAPFALLSQLYELNPSILIGVNILALLALFTTLLVLVRLSLECLITSAKNSTMPRIFQKHLFSLILILVIAYLVAIFYNQISHIIDAGVMMTIVFDLLICISAIKIMNSWKKIMPIIVTLALISCYIPDLLSGGWLMLLIFVSYTLVSIFLILFSLKSTNTSSKFSNETLSDEIELKSTQDLESQTYQDSLNIRMKVFVDEQNCPEELEREDEDKCIHYVLYEGNTAVGTFRLHPKTNDKVKFQRLAVLSEHRQKSYGKKLVSEAINIARSQGYKFLILDGQSYLKQFYLDLGFEITGDEFSEANIMHWPFQMNLS